MTVKHNLREDVLGKRFNQITIIGEQPDLRYPSGQRQRIVEGLCTCGNVGFYRLGDLKFGNTARCKSCRYTRLSKILCQSIETWWSETFLREFEGRMLGDGNVRIPTGGRNAKFAYSQSTEEEQENGHDRTPLVRRMQKQFSLHGIGGCFRKIRGGQVKICEHIAQGSSALNFSSHVTPTLTQQFARWYSSGIKVVPKDLVLSMEALTAWMEDDGTCSYDLQYPNLVSVYFCTHSFTRSEVDFLIDRLRIDLGLESYAARHQGKFIIRMGSKSAVAQLMGKIAPKIRPCCLYKLKWPDDPERKCEGRRRGPSSNNRKGCARKKS